MLFFNCSCKFQFFGLAFSSQQMSAIFEPLPGREDDPCSRIHTRNKRISARPASLHWSNSSSALPNSFPTLLPLNFLPLNISPFIERELKLALRQYRGGYRHVAAYITAGITILLLIFAIDASPRTTATLGKLIFGILGLLALFEALALGDAAAHLFSEERQNKTLALLFGTGISPSEVMIGKISAVLIAPLSRLVTIIPCLLIVSMMRSATLQVCVATVITLVVLFFLSLSLWLLFSLIFKEHTSGVMAAHGAAAFLLGFFPIIDFFNRSFGFAGLDRFWKSLNPATAPWLLFENPQTNSELGYVYFSVAYSAVLALTFFSVSAILLSRIWQDQVSGAPSLPFSKLINSFRTRKKRTARRSLDFNPYIWLISRDIHPAVVTWLTFAAITVIWLMAFWQWGASWLIPINFWVTLILLGFIIRWMTYYLSAKQIGIDRSTGALEPLLTTPLPVGDIISAHQTAVKNYTHPFYTFIAILNLVFFVVGLFSYPMPKDALRNYIIISAIIALFGPWFHFQGYWIPFWISLNSGRPMFAITRALFGGASSFSFFVLFFYASRINRLPNIPTGSFPESIVVSSLLIGLLLWTLFYYFCWTSDWNKSQKIKKLAILHLRHIAAQPLPESKDPQLQKWDHTEPLFEIERDPDHESDPEARDARSRERILSNAQLK